MSADVGIEEVLDSLMNVARWNRTCFDASSHCNLEAAQCSCDCDKCGTESTE